MKALRASAGTSQPVLSSQQVQTVFYQVPELRGLHQSFCLALKERLSHIEPSPLHEAGKDRKSSSGGEADTGHRGFELTVGDLFLKIVSCLYPVMLTGLKHKWMLRRFVWSL